ncbi:unnamed protein product [Ectocarpus sp. 12 AP-2014]
MKDQPFLNDPAAYPEFSLLIKRQSLQHKIRQTLHRQRTSALLVVVAMSIAASGADGSGGSSSAEWGVYLAKGMHLALLQKHFEGMVSALGCMMMGTVTSFLVYPIYQRCSPAAIQNPRAPPCLRFSSATTKTIAAAVPSIAVWAIAVYAAGVYRWGVASGLCVALQCAALTLKSVSFVQKARPIAAEAAIAVAAAHEDLDAAGVAANADGGDRAAAARGKLAISPARRSVLQGDHRSNPPSPTVNGDDGGARAADPTLTFREFAFFLVLAPSLVCRPQYLASGARRPPRVAAATSEFLHAGLTYIAVHVACSALFAPALRVLAEALHSGGVAGWADEEDWAELRRTDGSGWWLHDSSRSLGSLFASGGGGCVDGGVGCGPGWTFSDDGTGHPGLTVAIAACLGVFVFSPMMHFLMFYAFFHSVCLGCAELYGYPDRNTYGPWWLVVDDVRDYFRLWSAPVHRWLSESVQRPMIEVGQREALRRRRRRVAREEDTPPATNGKSGGSNGVHDHRPKGTSSTTGGKARHGADAGIVTRWWLASVVCSFLVSGVVHEAVGFVAMRRTVWPFSTFFLAVTASMAPFWDTLFPVVADTSTPGTRPTGRRAFASIAAAGGDGGGFSAATEAANSAAVPNTAAKPTTAKGTVNACSGNDIGAENGEAADGQHTGHPSKDVANKNGVVTGQQGREAPRLGRKGAPRPKIGRWRGWAAVVVYGGMYMPLALVVDYCVWQWWRHTHMPE